ncbi:hypothetical protein [Algoriphagus halophilus]|uniref:hypothetical protein n=1 Tax=Algoriphagus halophilus TaxID=226505 RepID=UPI001160F301|nr:hypothetical protein [Algoriphagus halophilus]
MEDRGRERQLEVISSSGQWSACLPKIGWRYAVWIVIASGAWQSHFRKSGLPRRLWSFPAYRQIGLHC